MGDWLSLVWGGVVGAGATAIALDYLLLCTAPTWIPKG